ncbi:MAG: S-layer homology domain-containing protein [Candidatus Gastranaerophilales bacterium]|nr:S-layer homology domain-containing protein [Candidatus Gastranaerophilales bacterium]
MKKKILSAFLAFSLMLSNVGAVLAANLNDINPNFFANEEINNVVDRKVIIPYQDNTFRPWVVVNRAEFTGMLLRALELDQTPITIKTAYKDVNEKTTGYKDIVIAEQIGLVYGYKDGTFQPKRIITKAETSSIMSHITKDTVIDKTILEQFNDYKMIPKWAVMPYAKAVKYGLYCNIPNPKILNPNAQLKRVEAAILLATLMKKLEYLNEQYRKQKAAEEEAAAAKKPEPPKEYILGTEHLETYPYAAVNKVTVTNFRKILLAKNVFQVSFLDTFMSKKHQVGDVVQLYFKQDVKTKEGTLIFPANTKLYATIKELKKPGWVNKNAEVYLDFTEVQYPSGKKIPFVARVLNNYDGVLKENYWQKPLVYTAAGAAVGTGVGLGIGGGTGKTSTGLAIGLPVGAGVGLATGFLTKGVNYKAKANENVYVELKLDCNLYNEGQEPKDQL